MITTIYGMRIKDKKNAMIINLLTKVYISIILMYETDEVIIVNKKQL